MAFSANTIFWLLEQRKIEPYIATGREAHHKDLNTLLGTTFPRLPEDATPLEKMAYKLSTEIGQAIYRLRKCTVEPVIGIIKEILGFRQFSLRGLKKVDRRMVFGLSGFQSQTTAHLLLGIGVALARLKPARKGRVALETCSFTPVLP